MRPCRSFLRGGLGEEGHHRLAVLGARVADALRLAALREYLMRRRLEALVEDGLAQRERSGGALAELGGPGLRIGDQRVGVGLAIGDAEGERLVDVDLAAA